MPGGDVDVSSTSIQSTYRKNFIARERASPRKSGLVFYNPYITRGIVVVKCRACGLFQKTPYHPTPDPKSCNVCVKSHRTLTPDKSLTKKVLLKNSTDLCMGRRPIYKSDEFFKSTPLVDQIYLDMTAVAHRTGVAPFGIRSRRRGPSF